MKLAFEGVLASGDKLRFYDDYTWIQPTPDGGIAEGGEWNIVEDELHFVVPMDTTSRRGKAYMNHLGVDFNGKAVDTLQDAFREWRARLERQVAAAIVGTHGGNY